MARARNIKPGFFKNAALGRCAPLTRLFFAGLWTQADWEGRIEFQPEQLRIEILPYDKKVDIISIVNDLIKNRLVECYSISHRENVDVFSRLALWIPTFALHQNPHKNEKSTPSKITPFTDKYRLIEIIPEEYDNNRDLYGILPDEYGAAPADSLIPDPSTLIPKNDLVPSLETTQATALDDILISFPVKGDPKVYDLPSEKAREWERTYGKDLNVLHTLKVAKQWLLDNPTRQKTAKGMTRFLGQWFQTAINGGSGAPPISRKAKAAEAARMRAATAADKGQPAPTAPRGSQKPESAEDVLRRMNR